MARCRRDVAECRLLRTDGADGDEAAAAASDGDGSTSTSAAGEAESLSLAPAALRALVDAAGRAPERLGALDLRTVAARGGGVEPPLDEAEATLRGWLPAADAARRAPARCSLVRDRRDGYLAIGSDVVGGQVERAC